MKAKLTFMTLITVVVALAGFGLIIYGVTRAFSSTCGGGMTYNKDLKQCVETCKDGEKFYPETKQCSKCPPGQTFDQAAGVCRAPCEGEEKHCGTKCYNPLSWDCIDPDTGLLCPVSSDSCKRVYVDDEGTKRCCKNCVGKTKAGKDDCCKKGFHVDEDGACVPCASGKNSCGINACCDKFETCCKDTKSDKGTCCKSGETCDAAGNCCSGDKYNGATQTCCESADLNAKNRCCKPPEFVDKDTKKCAAPCPPSPEPSVTPTKCYPDASPPEICRVYTNETTKEQKAGCAKQSCKTDIEWHPNPRNFYAPDSSDENAGVPVCSDKDGKYWFCSTEGRPMSSLNRKIVTSLTPAEDCTEFDCWGLVGKQPGASYNTYNAAGPTPGLCEATIDCGAAGTKTSRSCPEALKDILDTTPKLAENTQAICGYKDGDYSQVTGQICPDNLTCTSEGDCVGPSAIYKDQDKKLLENTDQVHYAGKLYCKSYDKADADPDKSYYIYDTQEICEDHLNQVSPPCVAPDDPAYHMLGRIKVDGENESNCYVKSLGFGTAKLPGMNGDPGTPHAVAGINDAIAYPSDSNTYNEYRQNLNQSGDWIYLTTDTDDDQYIEGTTGFITKVGPGDDAGVIGDTYPVKLPKGAIFCHGSKFATPGGGWGQTTPFPTTLAEPNVLSSPAPTWPGGEKNDESWGWYRCVNEKGCLYGDSNDTTGPLETTAKARFNIRTYDADTSRSFGEVVAWGTDLDNPGKDFPYCPYPGDSTATADKPNWPPVKTS